MCLLQRFKPCDFAERSRHELDNRRRNRDRLLRAFLAGILAGLALRPDRGQCPEQQLHREGELAEQSRDPERDRLEYRRRQLDRQRRDLDRDDGSGRGSVPANWYELGAVLMGAGTSKQEAMDRSGLEARYRPSIHKPVAQRIHRLICC